MLNAETSRARLAGVLGWPLAHTLSPAIHNAAFRALGLNAVYLAFAVREDELADALRAMRALRALGANATMPHKEAVVALVDQISPEAEVLRAVNAIEVDGEQLIGHNTDVAGLRDFMIADARLDARAKDVLVLGGGGAARAAVKAFDDLGVARIVVAARDVDAAHAVSRLATRAAGEAASWADAAAHAGRADVVLNATPLGMHGEDALPEARFGPQQVVIDLVYGRAETPFVARARAAGASASGGLGVLVRQGAHSLRLWTGLDPPIDVMMRAARSEIAR